MGILSLRMVSSQEFCCVISSPGHALPLWLLLFVFLSFRSHHDLDLLTKCARAYVLHTRAVLMFVHLTARFWYHLAT